MVGSNAPAFRPIANQYAIDRDRQSTCADDYYTINHGMEGLLGAGIGKKGHGTEVTVTYHDAGGHLKYAADAFRASGVFEQVAEDVAYQLQYFHAHRVQCATLRGGQCVLRSDYR